MAASVRPAPRTIEGATTQLADANVAVVSVAEALHDAGYPVRVFAQRDST
jgi:hypothetical protein